MADSNKNRNVPPRFLGAFKKGHRFSSRSMIDEDLSWELLDKIEESNYTDTASIQALEYLAKFNNEFHKNVVSKTDPFHVCNCPNRKKGDKHLEGCNRNSLNERENAKNRDIMSVQNEKVTRKDVSHQDFEETGFNDHSNSELDQAHFKKQGAASNYAEDAIIELIDLKNALNNQNTETEH